MSMKEPIEIKRVFTPATKLLADGKLVQNSKTKTYVIDKAVLAKGEEVLMSVTEFINGMKNIKGVPVTITPDGKQPVFPDIEAIEAKELKPIEEFKLSV